jgi:hypothetical protein
MDASSTSATRVDDDAASGGNAAQTVAALYDQTDPAAATT